MQGIKINKKKPLPTWNSQPRKVSEAIINPFKQWSASELCSTQCGPWARIASLRCKNTESQPSSQHYGIRICLITGSPGGLDAHESLKSSGCRAHRRERVSLCVAVMRDIFQRRECQALKQQVEFQQAVRKQSK